MKTKNYHPVYLGQRAQQNASPRWGVLIEIKGVTASLLGEWFETYLEADARVDELNRQEQTRALQALT